MRLFCFPYAGGSVAIFRDWQAGLPSAIEVCPVELPGRGSRPLETPFDALPDLCRALAADLLPRCDRPFSFFGHSVGALIAFEFARQLRREHGLLPASLFVAAHRAPRLLFSGRLARTLSDAEVLGRLSALGGTPLELLRQPELLRYRSEVLKADFTLSQTYAYHPEPPLACPIFAFGGMEDQEVTVDQLEPWRDETAGEFRLRRLPGQHFFLHSAQPLLLGILTHELRALTAAVPAARWVAR